MIGPRYSAGVMIVASTTGSSTQSYVPGGGISDGLWTVISSSPLRRVNSTFGAVALRSRSNSRSSRSFTIALCMSPRTPHRHPPPHETDPVAGSNLAIDHPDVRNHAAIRVVARVEDQGPKRSSRVAARRGDPAHHRLQGVWHPVAGLRGDPKDLTRFAPHQFG